MSVATTEPTDTGSGPPAPFNWAAELRLAGIAALVYLVGARLALWFVLQPEQLALIWPSAGVLLGFLLTTRRASWPLLVAATFVVIVGTNVWSGNSLATSVGFGVANTLESCVAAWVVLRVLGHEPRLDSTRDVAVFIAGAVLFSNGVTAWVGTTVVHLNSEASVGHTWLWWWIEDGMGMLLVGPVVVGTRQRWALADGAVIAPDWRDALAAVALVVLVVPVFVAPPNPEYTFVARPYLPLPLMLYLAVRNGPRGAVAAIVLVGIGSFVGLVGRTGAFITWSSDVRGQALGAQLFLGVVAATALVASAGSMERRRAERALRRREEELLTAERRARDAFRRLEEVIWGTSVGTWEWNVQTGECVFNDQWAEMAGYTLAELAPVTIETWKALAHPEDLDRSGEQLQRCFRREIETYECEVRLKHKSGHWIWVLDRGRVVEWGSAGRAIRMSGTHLDITERVRSRQQLEELAREQAVVLGTAPVAIMSIVDRRIKWCNAMCGELVGRSAEEMIGASTAEFYGDLQAYEEMGRVGYAALARGEAYGGEVRLKTRAGDGRWCLFTGRMVDAGRPELGSIWALQDISLRKEAEHRLQVFAETQRTLLREVNHRVKNNLAAILGIVHLEQDLAEAARQPLAVRVMQQLEARLRALANVHVVLSQTEWRPVRLDDLCRRIVGGAVQAGVVRGPVVRVEDSPVLVESDPAHSLALALSELGTNSMKYGMGPDGTIAVEIGIERTDGEVAITYRDHGRGYPAEMLDGSSRGRVGLELLQGLVTHNLRGRLALANEGGAVTVIRFPHVAVQGD